MPRLNKLADVMFPVVEHPIFVSIKGAKGEQRLPVPSKKALVNTSNNHVLGIVSQGYQLVSNRQALDWGIQCCGTIFPETKPSEWAVTTIDAPGTGGHCYLDIVHNSTALDFRDVPADQRPDTFGPFVRVCNSYNALRALSFNVGYFRKVCKNGMILPDTIIKFKFVHQRRDLKEAIRFDVEHEQLAKAKCNFASYLSAMRGCVVPRKTFEPMVRSALALPNPDPQTLNQKDAGDLSALNGHLSEMSDRYVKELGETAYAVFNAVTEFASQPPVNRFVHRERNSLQRLAGVWLTKFSQQCGEPGFQLDSFMTEPSETTSAVVSA